MNFKLLLVASQTSDFIYEIELLATQDYDKYNENQKRKSSNPKIHPF